MDGFKLRSLAEIAVAALYAVWLKIKKLFGAEPEDQQEDERNDP